MTQALCWAWLPEEHNRRHFTIKCCVFLALPLSHSRSLLEGFRFSSYLPKPSCEHIRKGVAFTLQLCKVPGPLLVLSMYTKLAFFHNRLEGTASSFLSHLLFISLSLRKKEGFQNQNGKKFIKCISYFTQVHTLVSI